MKGSHSLWLLLLIAHIGASVGVRKANEPFIATDQWQELGPDQAIPRGLHVRMNLQTGKREAKLLSDNKSESAGGSLALREQEDTPKGDPITLDEIREALINLKSEDGLSPKEQALEAAMKKKKLRRAKKLRQQMEQLDMKVETDQETLMRLTSSFKERGPSLRVLRDIQSLVHQIDNAIDFTHMGGIQKIVKPCLNATDTDIEKEAMLIVASAAQNNPKVQVEMVKHGVLNDLLRTMLSHKQIDVVSRALHAVSCVVRGFPYGQHVLLENAGIPILRDILLKDHWHLLKLQFKVLTLVNDLLDERQWATGDRLLQLREVPLAEHLYESDWCAALTALLKKATVAGQSQPDHSMVMTILHSLKALPQCGRDAASRHLLRRLERYYGSVVEDMSPWDDTRELMQDIHSIILSVYNDSSSRFEL